MTHTHCDRCKEVITDGIRILNIGWKADSFTGSLYGGPFELCKECVGLIRGVINDTPSGEAVWHDGEKEAANDGRD